MKSRARLLSHAGFLWERLIQEWVQLSGRLVDATRAPWLAGPSGTDKIGPGFYASYAQDNDLVVQYRPDAGLLESFTALRSAHFAPEKVQPEIREFYEETAQYSLDVWAQWKGPISLFARAMITSISRNIEQFMLPLNSLATSRDMSSKIISLVDKETRSVVYASWLRKAMPTGDVVYAGFYTTCRPPHYARTCVKVVFPLPGGSATVILRPVNGPNGSFKLVSDGHRFGGPGSYRIHRLKNGNMRVKYIPIEETIHVYVAEGKVLRADHHFRFWGIPYLTLHYRIVRKQPQGVLG